MEAKSNLREDLNIGREGSITLNQLMTTRADKLGLHGERLPFIYISTMKAREIFVSVIFYVQSKWDKMTSISNDNIRFM